MREQWKKQQCIAEEKLQDPFGAIAMETHEDLVGAQIMSMLGDPASPGFKTDTVIVLQGNPFLRNKARNQVVTKDGDSSHYTRPWYDYRRSSKNTKYRVHT